MGPLGYRESVAARSRLQTFLVDLLLADVLAATALAIPLGSSDSDFAATAPAPDSLIDWLILVGAAWAVPFRRLAPVTALAVGAVLQMVVWTIGYPDTFMATAVLLYSAAAHGEPRRRPWVWAAAAVLTFWTGLGVVATDDVPFYALPLVGLFSVAAVSFGSTIAARQASAEAAEARALELERSRQADGDRALAEERSRIARELHDVVAHGLSVMVVQAAAARRIIDRDPAGAANALGQIEQTGREALTEMRHVLAAIRTEPDESWRPIRSLTDLDALVTEMDQAGLTVTVNRQPLEEDAVDPAPIPATVDVTAYRIVQESLTNVLKHGGDGASARVEIVRHPESVELRVTDDGQGARARDGGGHGLRGMQERVEVFGGTFRAGPRLGGGFTVEATLPWAASRERASR